MHYWLLVRLRAGRHGTRTSAHVCTTGCLCACVQGTMMHELVQFALATAAKGPLTREALEEYVSERMARPRWVCACPLASGA